MRTTPAQGPGPKFRLAMAASAVVYTSLALNPAGADEKRPYRQPVDGAAVTSELDVIIVPPAHGPRNDPSQVGTTNIYLQAAEDSIEAWRHGIKKLAPAWLTDQLQFRAYVLGRDQIPERALAEPEVIVNFSERHPGGGTGSATWQEGGRLCLIDLGMGDVVPFAYTDVYNTNLQEFGHCMGLDHVTFPPTGASDPVVGHDAMNGNPDDPLGDPSTHLHCLSNINIGGLERFFAPLLGPTMPFTHPIAVAADEYRQLKCPQEKPDDDLRPASL